MRIKKDKGSLEYIYCLLCVFIVCLITIISVNVSTYKMKKEHIENFVTDSVLSGAVINLSRFNMTGYITNYDIKKTYSNFTTCLKNNLKLGTTTQTNGVITNFKGPEKDLIITNDQDAIKITDYYLYNSEYDGDPKEENTTGKFYVMKLIENNTVNNNPQNVLYSENINNTTVTLSESTGKNKIVPLKANTMVIYVRLEIKLKNFSIGIWGNEYYTDKTTGIHEYLVDVTENEVYRHEKENI